MDASAHIIYMVMEAPSIQKIQVFLSPLLGLGTAETIPVMTTAEALQMADEMD